MGLVEGKKKGINAKFGSRVSDLIPPISLPSSLFTPPPRATDDRVTLGRLFSRDNIAREIFWHLFLSHRIYKEPTIV